MCGIAGYYSVNGLTVDKKRIESMLIELRHRGPDGFGIYYGGDCVLGHTRLSIIDLKGGWQPIFNEDESIVITFNGEIYNYIELRKELESSGHIFYTKSDTEVIIHAYEEWGESCPKRFNGQFAFAIYDDRKKSLFLCRDRLGVRPLYYGWKDNVFVFGSEIKSIIASGLISPEISYNGLHQIYSLWTNVFPYTPFANIFEVPPSHTMLVSLKGISFCRYWEIPKQTDTRRPVDEYEEGVLYHLRRSIRLRLRADVPVAAYISGGLDSALTTTLAKIGANSKLKTFSLEFTDPRYNESEFQREVVNHLHTDHSSILCKPEDVVNNIENVIWATERPILRTAPVPMYLLSKLVNEEGYRVVITGEGADEFFLGYDIMKEVKIREFCSRQPKSKIRPLLLQRLYPYLMKDPRTAKFQEMFFLKHFTETQDPFYGHRLRWNLSKRIRDFYTPAMDEHTRSRNPEDALLENLGFGFLSLSQSERTQLVEIDTLLSGYLLSSQGDRVSMAHSVEGRFVFLDHELIEFASRIPARVKMPGLAEKFILKKIGRTLLPERILQRKKFPYRAPDIDSFLSCAIGKNLLVKYLDVDFMKSTGIFDEDKIQRLINNVLKLGQEKITTTDNMILMAALSTQIFYHKFFNFPPMGKTFGPNDHVRWTARGEGKCLKVA